MPHEFERRKKLIPRKLKRSVKLSPEQREEIRSNADGLSNHALAAKYGVSRRLIQFIRFPERHAKNLLDRQLRGGSKRYYKKEYHTEKIREARHYKLELDKQQLLEEAKQ